MPIPKVPNWHKLDQKNNIKIHKKTGPFFSGMVQCVPDWHIFYVPCANLALSGCARNSNFLNIIQNIQTFLKKGPFFYVPVCANLALLELAHLESVLKIFFGTIKKLMVKIKMKNVI